jgi:hypothetical protein
VKFQAVKAILSSRLFEEFYPLLFRQWMMSIQPAFERTMLLAQFQYLLRIEDGRIDLSTIANDARIGKQSHPILFAVFGHFFNLESLIGFLEVFSLL